MILLNLKVDNVYMFNNFEIDFTYPKKIVNSPIEYEYLAEAPKINYKKINIIMGSNASGKTTLGKLLCDLQNFLLGQNGNFIRHRNDATRPGEVNMLFALLGYIYEYKIVFDGEKIEEKIKKIKLFKSYNFKKVKSKLDKLKYLTEEYEFDVELPVISKLCTNNKIVLGDNLITYAKYFKSTMGFYYRFATFTEKSNAITKMTDTLLKNIEICLKTIDPSIEGVRKSSSRGLSEEEVMDEKGYMIIFKSGERKFVDEGNIRLLENRLSQGTIETVELAEIMSIANEYNTIYLDEQMAYMHTTLSNQIILKLIEDMIPNSQLFITTHNENALDLNIPIHSFMFLVRKEDQIKVVHPEETLKKNDRSLIEYVQNNYFDTNPNLDKLWEIGD